MNNFRKSFEQDLCRLQLSTMGLGGRKLRSDFIGIEMLEGKFLKVFLGERGFASPIRAAHNHGNLF